MSMCSQEKMGPVVPSLASFYRQAQRKEAVSTALGWMASSSRSSSSASFISVAVGFALVEADRKKKKTKEKEDRPTK